MIETQYFEQFKGDEPEPQGQWWVVSPHFAKSWHSTQTEAIKTAENYLEEYPDLEVVYIPPGQWIGMRILPFGGLQ